MQYEYVKYLNQSTTNYVVTAAVNRYIAKDVNKEYAFRVNFVCQGGGATTGANIKVYKPNFTTNTLDYLGEVSAGTTSSPSDLDTGAVATETVPCEFEEYFTSVNPEYVVFQFMAYTDIEFEADVTAVSEFKVKWGDGSETTYAAGAQTISHTYSIIKYYPIRIISEDEEAITGIEFQSASDVRFDLSALPRSLTSLKADLSNHITGDVADAPRPLVYFYVGGSNTIYGFSRDLPPYLETLILYGDNELGDSVEFLPRTLQLLSITGQNTLYGRTDMFPSTCTFIEVLGNNTISYLIQAFTAPLTSLQLQGDNLVEGDLGLTPATLGNVLLVGNNTISHYTSKTWSADIDTFWIQPLVGFGLSSAEVDQLLIDLSAATFIGAKTVKIIGGNAARTAASDAAVTSLEAQGCTVETNP